MKPSKLLTIALAMIMVITSSCKSLTYLDHPLTSSIPNSLKKGEKVKIIFTDGHTTGKMIVDSVWPDSIRLVNDTKAIPISSISEIQALRFDPVLTTFVVVVPLGLITILIVNFSENGIGNPFKGPLK